MKAEYVQINGQYVSKGKTMKWSEYKFPDWVPATIRQQLQEFWAEEFGRSPDEWRKNVHEQYNCHPKLGERVTCKAMWPSEGKRKFAGRWVPMWNNIGRLVRSNGEVFVMSTGCIIKRRPHAQT